MMKTGKTKQLEQSVEALRAEVAELKGLIGHGEKAAKKDSKKG